MLGNRPLTAKLRWRPFSSVPHVSDRLELHNNNWASWILHPGLSESDVYSDVIQEAQSNDLLHMVRLLMRLDMSLHGNNARSAKYAVYYASVAMHTVFKNIKWLRSELCRIRNVAVPSLACLFPAGTPNCMCMIVNRVQKRWHHKKNLKFFFFFFFFAFQHFGYHVSVEHDENIHSPNLVRIGSWWPEIWPHNYLISPTEISVKWPGSKQLWTRPIYTDLNGAK